MSFQDLEKGRSAGIRRGGIANGKQDPTQAVASGIFQINTAVSTFHRLVNTLGTPKDTPELREKLWVYKFSSIIVNFICDFFDENWMCLTGLSVNLVVVDYEFYCGLRLVLVKFCKLHMHLIVVEIGFDIIGLWFCLVLVVDCVDPLDSRLSFLWNECVCICISFYYCFWKLWLI